MPIERLLVFRNMYILVSTRSMIKCHLRALNVPFFVQESRMRKKNVCEKNFRNIESDLKFTSEY